MPNGTTPSSLQTQAAGYQKDYISDFDRYALGIHAMIVILASTSSVNYIGNVGQLVKDSEAATSGMTIGDLDVAIYGILSQWANTLNSTAYPLPSNSALQQVPTQRTRALETLKREFVYLLDQWRQNLV